MQNTINKKFFTTVAFLRKAFPGYKWPMFGLFIFSLISSFLEGLGINAIIPLFSLLDEQNGGTDVVSSSIKSWFLFFHVPFSITSILVAIVCIFIIKGLILMGVMYYSANYIFSYEQKIRTEILQKTFKASWPFLIEQKGGHIEQVLTADVNRASSLIGFLVNSTTLFTSLLIYSLLVVNISLIIAVLTFVFGLGLLAIFNPLFYRNRLGAREVNKLYKNIAHQVGQGMWGMKTIKAMAVEPAFTTRVYKYFDVIRSLSIRIAWFKNATTVVLQPIGIIFILGIFAFFYKTNNFHFASFAVVVYAINKVFGSIQTLQGQIYQINETLPYLVAVEEYRAKVSEAQELHAGTAPFSFKEIILFKKLSFNYRPEKTVLKAVDLSIKKGEMIGLVGPSGGGKTTLADLLLQLYTPQAGEIALDGVPIDQIKLEEWRHNIGYVAQEPFLLNDSIRNNITFYNQKITDEALEEAAKAASVYEVIMGLPEKFDTVIGDRGVFLSVGQRQRIVLARIFLLQPQILILDEATSALDSESESYIDESIQKLRGKTTIIAIAHRLSTVMAADKVVVLEGGKIVEQGSPKILAEAKESYFYRMLHIKENL